MEYSSKRLTHDIQLLNRRLQATDNNMYRLHEPSLQITTINRSHQLGKAIVIKINESTIIAQPDLPFPETILYRTLPHPNGQLIHDLKRIFNKYQAWYFQH